MNNLEFALEMKNKRLASGLSQGELASLTHVSRYSINRFENGKANASKETQNIILRCLNYYVCDKPFYLLVDYLSVRFPTTDALEVIRKVLGMKADYFIHYDYGYYGYKEHYAYGEIKVMASDDEHMGVFLELKGAGSRNMEYVLQAQNRDWYSFLNRCLDCGGVIRRFDLAINDMCGLLDIPVLSEKYKNGGADCRCKNYENVQGGKLSEKKRNLASTLYIGSKASTKYFCLYEKQKEQATKKKHTDIINRFEIRLRDKKAVQAVEELLLTYNPHGLVFYLITDFVQFPDYPLWEIFISHDSLPFEMNPVPVNMERTLQWLERQVIPYLPNVINVLFTGVIALFTQFLPGMMMAYFLIVSTTVSEFVAAMDRMHVTKKISMPLSVLFRFFPTIVEEYGHVRDAMMMRDVGSIRNPMKMLEYRMVPFLTSIVSIGNDLSASALTRGLNAPVNRTNVCPIGFTWRDGIAFFVIICCLIIFIFFR